MVINKNVYKPHQRKNKSNLIRIGFDIITLDSIVKYVVQPSTVIRMDHLVNLKKMVTQMDPVVYQNNPDKVKRLDFIRTALDARLEHNLTSKEMILSYTINHLGFEADFIDINQLDLNSNEIEYIHDLIKETVQYEFVYQSVDDLLDICTRFQTSDYLSRGKIVEELEDRIDQLKTNFRQSRVNNNAINMEFSLKEGVFENAITDTYNIITNPSRRLRCGMQGLNMMTGGGFENGRVYMLMGTSGVGKSITLLNLIYQIKMYNSNYKTKDPTKTPCIVLLTMENTVVETITRLFDLVVPDASGMENYQIDEVIQKLREEGNLKVTSESPIDIVIRYKANKSVDTSYLYTLYDDLSDEGYEVICLVQDHVKRIRSISPNPDIRLELGDIVNELKVFAAEKDIPVISNTHLNRDASRILEDASRKPNQDAGKLLGKSNIGESMLMIDNLDCGIIIAIDYDENENRYMAFNLIKMRDKTYKTYMAQPFEKESTIKLMTDEGQKPLYQDSLHKPPQLQRNKSTVKKATASSNLDKAEKDLNDFVESTKSSYVMKPSKNDFENNKEQIVEDAVYFFKKDSIDIKNALKEFKSLENSNSNYLGDDYKEYNSVEIPNDNKSEEVEDAIYFFEKTA